MLDIKSNLFIEKESTGTQTRSRRTTDQFTARDNQMGDNEMVSRDGNPIGN